MKIWQSRHSGGPETLEIADAPCPQAGPDEIIIAVKACGLNFPDNLMLRDQYQVRLPRPITPGCEVSGIVVEVGAGVRDLPTGAKVVGLITGGGLAQFARLRAADSYLLPEGVSFVEGAGVIFTYATAYYALKRRAGLQPNDRVLVLGAGGGIGLAATELATLLGAQVVAAASDEYKLEIAGQKGAVDTILYPRIIDRGAAKALGTRLKDAAGGGFDIVADPVGGDYCEPALRAVAWAGRYLVIGFAAGIPKPALNLALLKGCSIVGVDWHQHGLREAAVRSADVQALLDMVATGKISVKSTEIVPFEDAPAALQKLEKRMLNGKAIVQVAN